MATVHSYGAFYDASLEDLPTWKKDLILRKRANARAYGIAVRGAGGGSNLLGVASAPRQNDARSQQGPSQLSARSGEGPHESECSLRGYHQPMTSRNTSSKGSAERKTFSSFVRDTEASGDDGRGASECDYDVSSGGNFAKNNSEMHHKGLFNKSCRVPALAKDSKLEEDQELEYGPGIVSRLKDRYLSLAMRESRARASLRKYSSLEDLLDESPESSWPERGRAAIKTRTVAGTPPVRREIMKRTRSMDSLALRRVDSVENKMPKSQSSGGIRQAQFAAALSKDVIIIEAPRVDKPPPEVAIKALPPSVALKGESEAPRKVFTSASQLEDEEMPPPDTVKQVKQIFEGGAPSAKAGRGTAAKVAAYKASQAAKKGVKPAIKAKPLQLLQSKKFLNSTVEGARSSLKQVPVVGRAAPRSTLSIKAVPLTNGSSHHSNSPSPTLLSGLTPVSASVTAPLVNGDHHLDPEGDADKGGVKRVSQAAISNIRKESSSLDFDFTDTSSRVPPVHRPSRATRPLSPIPANLPQSPTLTHKVSIPQAFKEDLDSTKENQRVLQENRKNAEKSSKPFKERHSNAKSSSDPCPLGDALPPDSQGSKSGDPPPQPAPLIEAVKSNHSYSAQDLVPTEDDLHSPAPPSSGCQSKELPAATGRSEPSDKGPQQDPPVKGGSPFAPSSASTPVASLKPTKGRERWHQQENNTLVFNFAKRADTPDYIENDGVDLSKRRHMHETAGYVIMAGYDGRLDSSTDGDDPEDESYDGSRGGVPPSPSPQPLAPCNISFVGEGVIINGRSNLQRQPRSKKLEISFDMVSTKIFEYPSEDSLLGEMEERLTDNPSSPAVTTLSSGGLANYTPSKLLLSDSFELGVSRTTAVHPPTPPRERPPPGFEDEDDLESEYLRPASETETIAWSSESVPDLLF